MYIEESLTAKGYTPRAQVPRVYGRPRTLESITIHWWGSYGQTHEGVVNFFVNGPGTTSAHFVASDGKVHCLVDPWDAAWHAGNPIGNASSIGIECRPEGTDGDYQTVAELIAWLRAEYGDLPLVPHNQWQATQCPGTYDLDRLDSLARGVSLVPLSSTPPIEEYKVTPEQMYELKVWTQECVNKAINQIWSTAAGTQGMVQDVAKGLNKIQAGAVDIDALAKAVNDDAAKRMEQ